MKEFMTDSIRHLAVLLVVAGSSAAAPAVDFSREILPVLSDACFSCHGPDEQHRKAKLRLDTREGALHAIKPGDPLGSELFRRVITTAPDELMPPPESHRKALDPATIEKLEIWIADGAQWDTHWAFKNPTRPKPPLAKPHPIDAFVQATLRAEQLEPAPPASRATLIRRVAFDLTGLPPTEAEVDAFLSDDSADAWGKVVDRLLDSPHFGERMAMWWLDAARYSDTDGYQQDATRNNWPWRDWVVSAFNRNQPFDRFTIEQFAGDLLPEATPEQRVATCFHRNHMTNGEGGRDPDESRIDYVIDRVNTMGTVWLGLTLGCVQCHSHKFDPITQRDYYGLFAFFNSIDEDGRAGGGARPYFKYQSREAAAVVAEAEAFVKELEPRLARERAAAEQRFQPWLKAQLERTHAGFTTWHPLRAETLKAVVGTTLTQDTNHVVRASGLNPRQDDYHFTARPELPRIAGFKLEVLPHADHTGGRFTRGASGEFILTDVKLMVRRRGQSQVRDIEFARAVADVEKKVKGRNYGLVKDTLDDDPRNGWTTAGADEIAPRVAQFELVEPLELAADEEFTFVLLHRSTEGDANIGRFRLSVTDQRGETVRKIGSSPLAELAAAKPTSPDAIEPKLRRRLLEQYLLDDARWQAAKERGDRARKQLGEFKKAAGKLNVMVLAELEDPRRTHILERGVWDAKGDEVAHGVIPAVLPWAGGEKPTRRDLAAWLTSDQNPLTARVIANQLWQLCFGAGLVRTPDDFGLQGEGPTHPELLDWLAVEFRESGWDVKRLLKTIVTSETYRQSSDVSAALLERDPENRLLARATRFRLPAWMIRDAALRSAGLLNPRLGGPPVRPYQPIGVWREIFMGRFTYDPSVGPAQYRRTLYAFWRRSSAPTFLFDSSQRRVCEVSPRRTNTPLQALTLMNDTTMLEAARTLADSVADVAGLEDRLGRLYRRVLSRAPAQHELAILKREYSRAEEHYRASPADALAFATVGQLDPPAEKDAPRRAADMFVADLILNLDEAITHE